MKHLLIITTDIFPRGNAGATRQEVLAKLLVQCGYDIDVIGMGANTNDGFITLSEHIKYTSFRNKNNSIISRFLGRMLFGYRVSKYLCRNKGYDAILVISVPYSIIHSVKKYKKKNDIILLHDSVEWYSPCEYRLGKFDYHYIQKDLMNRKWIDKQFKIIAISFYLKNYFESKKIKCVRIPFVFDVLGEVSHKSEPQENKIVFMYAGMIGRKDHIVDFLTAVRSLPEIFFDKVYVELFGFNMDYLCKIGKISPKFIESFGDHLHINGRVSRKTVETNLEKADFTILFRNPDERYAKAGFPTKIVESLKYSTPVFCNLSSDLDKYLLDNENSIVCKSEKPADIQIALKRTINLSIQERRNMQQNARDTAEKYFDYRMYSKNIEALFEE